MRVGPRGTRRVAVPHTHMQAVAAREINLINSTFWQIYWISLFFPLLVFIICNRCTASTSSCPMHHCPFSTFHFSFTIYHLTYTIFHFSFANFPILHFAYPFRLHCAHFGRIIELNYFERHSGQCATCNVSQVAIQMGATLFFSLKVSCQWVGSKRKRERRGGYTIRLWGYTSSPSFSPISPYLSSSFLLCCRMSPVACCLLPVACCLLPVLLQLRLL